MQKKYTLGQPVHKREIDNNANQALNISANLCRIVVGIQEQFKVKNIKSWSVISHRYILDRVIDTEKRSTIPDFSVEPEKNTNCYIWVKNYGT